MKTGSFQSIGILAAEAVQAPVLASGSGPDVSAWRVVLALVLCLVLAGIAAWLLRQRMGGVSPWSLRAASAGRLRLVERIVLGPQSSAALITVDGQELLVVTGPAGTAIQSVAQRAEAGTVQ